MRSGQKKRLTLGTPAEYRIRVQGRLEERWFDFIGSFKITVSKESHGGPLTILSGRIQDQAELLGVLNSLYELRMPILSVELLGVKQEVC